MTEQVALECENGHKMVGEINDAGRVQAVAISTKNGAIARGCPRGFAECTFCPLCGAEIRQEHGSEIGVVRA